MGIINKMSKHQVLKKIHFKLIIFKQVMMQTINISNSSKINLVIPI